MQVHSLPFRRLRAVDRYRLSYRGTIRRLPMSSNHLETRFSVLSSSHTPEIEWNEGMGSVPTIPMKMVVKPVRRLGALP